MIPAALFGEQLRCRISSVITRPARMPPLREVLMELHRVAASTGIVKAEDLKIRAQALEDYLVAGELWSFFHVALYMLAGRTSESGGRIPDAIAGDEK